jgi:2,3-bisphosphoglycerate-independent phosphoglycerate mutase
MPTPRKYVIVLPDGATDEKLPQLGGRTPLEVARIPHMDWVAAHGELGRIVTIPPGFTPGTDVGTLTLLGYDPHRDYSGRAPIEACAKGLTAQPDQLIFRCNFVTIADGRMQDFTAGHIAQAEADALVAALNDALGGDGCSFHAGVSYRNLMLLAHAADLTLACAPPHDIPDQPVADHPPRGAGAERVVEIMRRARAVIARHPVNAARRAAGRDPVTDIWLWGQGRPTRLEPFVEKYGVRAAAITAVDIIRGMAVATGMDLIAVPGATGYIDTDYDAKGRAAVAALDRYDCVLVHVEAADEAGHLGDAGEKVKALERIDEAVVGPLLAALQRYPAWRILVAPDHPTPASTKAHSAVPPHYAFAGDGVAPAGGPRFTEDAALATGRLEQAGHTLLARFFG